jgi:hypothetical protein
MNIFALIAILSLNYFAPKAKQMKTPPALAATTMTLNEYFPLSPLRDKLGAVKGHLSRLREVPLVTHALPQVVPPVKYSSLSGKLQRTQIRRTNTI